MVFLEPHAAPPRRRRWPFVAVTLLVLVAAYAAWRATRPAAPAPRATAPPPVAGPAQPATGGVDVRADVAGAVVSVDGRRLGPAPRVAEGLAPGAHLVRVEAPGHPAYEQEVHVVPGHVARVDVRLHGRAASAPASAPAAAAGGLELRVESDVPGASVFVDRRFHGHAPVVVRGLDPGQHRLNVTAEGYEMQGQDLDLRSSTTVNMRFKEVRLDEAFDVVHKHGFGSCEGRLAAAVDGLRYTPAKGDHGFNVPLGALQTFSVNYLDRELRVKSGGRTWNFTTRDKNADALLRFQQKVDAARQRLGG